MDRTIDQLKTMDYFFYYGLCPIEEEVQHDIIVGILQPRRQLMYDRANGAGIAEVENAPMGASFVIKAKYNLTSWAARRNREVSNGSDGLPDRRVAVSQSMVNVKFPKMGEVDIDMLYIPLYDYKRPVSMSMPLAVGSEV